MTEYFVPAGRTDSHRSLAFAKSVEVEQDTDMAVVHALGPVWHLP